MGLIVVNSLEVMLKLLNNENQIIKKSTSWFILQMTDSFTKAFTADTLNYLIPTLINCLGQNNNIAINICYSLINLIKNLGDSATVKNTSNKLIFM
jgi:hypothetical protein